MDKTVKLELNIDMLNIILLGLGKVPLEHSFETFMYVRKEAEIQLKDKPQGPLADKVMN